MEAIPGDRGWVRLLRENAFPVAEVPTRARGIRIDATGTRRDEPSMLNSAQQASRDQFDRQSDRYGKSHILADVSDLDAALAGVPVPGGGRVLDVATGGGHTALYFARRGFEVLATDLSSAMLKNAAALAAGEGFVIATAEHAAEVLPYPDRAFAIVSCRVAAHHFSDPTAFAREAARVLEPSGLLVVIDGSVPDGEAEAEAWSHALEKLRDPSHGRFLTPGGWRWLAENAGFEVLRCEASPFKMPDLDWYFETAGTPEQNRSAVRELVRTAPPAARRVFRITEEEGRIVWWWTRLTLVARKVTEMPQAYAERIH